MLAAARSIHWLSSTLNAFLFYYENSQKGRRALQLGINWDFTPHTQELKDSEIRFELFLCKILQNTIYLLSLCFFSLISHSKTGVTEFCRKRLIPYSQLGEEANKIYSSKILVFHQPYNSSQNLYRWPGIELEQHKLQCMGLSPFKQLECGAI